MEAERAWDRLEQTWRACFELAWESFSAGSVGVGAVVTDAEGVIVAQGRARSMEAFALPGQLGNATVAHAELNALGRIPVGPHPGYEIHTTLEPCLMCAGAIIIANIRTVRYAGADALWAGLERLPEANAFVGSRWPTRIGPRPDEFGLFATLLPLLFYVERYPAGATTESHLNAVPDLLDLARSLVRSGEHDSWRRLQVADALQLVLPRLGEIAGALPTRSDASWIARPTRRGEVRRI